MRVSLFCHFLTLLEQTAMYYNTNYNNTLTRKPLLAVFHLPICAIRFSDTNIFGRAKIHGPTKTFTIYIRIFMTVFFSCLNFPNWLLNTICIARCILEQVHCIALCCVARSIEILTSYLQCGVDRAKSRTP